MVRDNVVLYKGKSVPKVPSYKIRKKLHLKRRIPKYSYRHISSDCVSRNSKYKVKNGKHFLQGPFATLPSQKYDLEILTRQQLCTLLSHFNLSST